MPAASSWDAFWAAQTGSDARTETIRGVQVTAPVDLPLAVMSKLDALTSSTDVEDVRSLTVDVFGAGVYEAWVAAGMGFLELQTVLAWGIAHGTGTPLTFAEAHARVAEQVAALGKAPAPGNRAERRAATRARPTSATGGPSKPTSRGSTASTRRPSRR